MNEPKLVTGAYHDGKLGQTYAYMAKRSTVFDAELIQDAERRAAEHKRRQPARLAPGALRARKEAQEVAEDQRRYEDEQRAKR